MKPDELVNQLLALDSAAGAKTILRETVPVVEFDDHISRPHAVFYPVIARRRQAERTSWDEFIRLSRFANHDRLVVGASFLLCNKLSAIIQGPQGPLGKFILTVFALDFLAHYGCQHLATPF